MSASNTASGSSALFSNTTGSSNTASGFNALMKDTTGGSNTATGVSALLSNTTGSFNTASGASALVHSTTGNGNAASGVSALAQNTTGANNAAEGLSALGNNTTGSGNIGVGSNAGINLTTRSNNIDIGNGGVAAESGKIRIGTQGKQTATFIAGISGVSVTGDAVVVNSSGQLGIVMSSARYKRDIHEMDTASSKLMGLRPVTFRYKQDPQGERQYGLIAEEVARVYPELVSYGADGKVMTVHYHAIGPDAAQRVAEAGRAEPAPVRASDRREGQP